MESWHDDPFGPLLAELAGKPSSTGQFHITCRWQTELKTHVGDQIFRGRMLYSGGPRVAYYELRGVVPYNSEHRVLALVPGTILRIEVHTGHDDPKVYEHPDYKRIAVVDALLNIGGTREPFSPREFPRQRMFDHSPKLPRSQGIILNPRSA